MAKSPLYKGDKKPKGNNSSSGPGQLNPAVVELIKILSEIVIETYSADWGMDDHARKKTIDRATESGGSN